MSSTLDKGSNLEKRRVRKQDSARLEKNEAYQKKRREVLEVAKQLFLKNGYGHTTLSDIATKLNFDRATLYYYASSKQEIYDAIVDEIAERNVLQIETIANSGKRAKTKLREAIICLNESYRESFPLLQIYLNNYLNHLGHKKGAEFTAATSWSVRYYQAVRAILKQGVDQKEFTLPLPVGVTTLGVIGMLNWSQVTSSVGSKSNTTDRLSSEDIGDGFAELLFAGIVRPSKPKRPARKVNSD